jgi:hypothetical protein
MEQAMDLIVVVAAFPIGWLVQHRLTAFVIYLAGFNFLFTFQSTVLITDWAGGSKSAFGSFPKASSSDLWGYGVVNLIFLAAGIGLLVAGRYVSDRVRARRTDSTLTERVPA